MKETIIRKIIDKQVSIFCGAGISYDSGVPLVNEIKSKILSKLPLDTSDFDFLINYSMPFELFMESLIENSSSTALLELFEIGTYNTNHLLIANLVKAGYVKTMVTTNFDNFLESALDDMNVNYKLYYKEDEFADINWQNEEVRLIKIHGSIDDKLNMAVTIKKVSSKELVYSRNRVIQNLLKESQSDSVFFLGYSCSDIFDINPTIKSLQEKTKTIFYFQHNNNDFENYTFQPISDKIEPNPFLGFNGNLINGNTNKFINDVWINVLKTSYIETKNIIPDWSIIVDKWMTEIIKLNGNEIVFYLAGQLLISSSRHSKALGYFLRGLELTEENGNDNLSLDFLFSIGRTYRDMQKLNEGLQDSLRYLHLGLKKSRRLKNKKKECTILLSLGVTYEDKKDHTAAIKYYEDALKIAENIPDRQIVSKCLGNLGIVFKNLADANPTHKVSLLKKAIVYQRNSLNISIEDGDKRSEGRTYGNIATILSRQGNRDEAIEYSKKALAIAIELSDVYHQGIWKHNIAYDYIGINNIEAKKYLSEAREIFTSEGLISYVKICDETMAKIIQSEEITK